MKKLLILIIPAALLYGCKNNDTFVVDGNIKETPKEYIFISKVDVNTLLLIDSVRISKKGNFRFRITTSEPDFYQLGLSPDNFITLLAEPGERIVLQFPQSELYESYSVTGSKGSELVQNLDSMLLETRKKLDSLNLLYDKVYADAGAASEKQNLEKQILDIVKAQRRYNIEFIISNITSLATIKALFQKLNDQTYVLYDPRDLQYLKISSDSLKKYFPESRHTRSLLSTFEKEMNQYNIRKFNMMIDTLPSVKLDPVLKDINGKKVALSSLRGKYVLVTFWTSESRECITENLQLKQFYGLYHRKCFEIYQISLDTDESAWRTSVRYDELPWISVREEDPGSQRSALLFNVKSVPANYLFDPQGNIIASNLHGRNLQLKLNQLFNN